jgi:hypothetical protein
VDLFSNCWPGNWGSTPVCSASRRAAKPDASGDYLIAPNEGSSLDGFAEVHTFYHLNQMHDWFKAAGFDGLDILMPVAVNFTLDPYGLSCNAGYGESTILVGLCDMGSGR